MKNLKKFEGKAVKNAKAVKGGKEEANQLKAALEAVGATVDLK